MSQQHINSSERMSQLVKKVSFQYGAVGDDCVAVSEHPNKQGGRQVPCGWREGGKHFGCGRSVKRSRVWSKGGPHHESALRCWFVWRLRYRVAKAPYQGVAWQTFQVGQALEERQ